MKNKRILALATALLIGATALSTLASCGRRKKADYDPTKANLMVATFSGGVGTAWLEEAAVRFEEKYADATHFQKGRTGVNIAVDGNKDTYGGKSLSTSALTQDVYFTEGIEYYKFVNQGKVADISDVVTGKLTTYGEDKTIESKLDPAIQTYLKSANNNDGKYYMLPFYDGFYGLIYDVELFENKGFYFDENGYFLKKTVANANTFESKKSAGPNGRKGDYDDGLPATYDQMIQLVAQIRSSSCIPFCYSGSIFDYVDKACRAFIADYEGYEGFKMNFTFNGTAKVVDSISADGKTVTTKEVQITPKNAYELAGQAGRYYALYMQDQLFGDIKNVGMSWNSDGYIIAQGNYISSKHTDTPYAFLAEGVWWENEAESSFNAVEGMYGEKKSDRRFGFLPMPKANQSIVDQQQGQTLYASNSSFCFVNAKCENMELAKEFIRFLHTDAEMSKFSAKTSIPRSLNYEVSAEDRKTATNFGKTLIDLRADAKVVYPYSSVSLINDNPDDFTESMWFLTTDGGANSPFSAFKDDKMTASQYFKGFYTYQKKKWEAKKWNV